MARLRFPSFVLAALVAGIAPSTLCAQEGPAPGAPASAATKQILQSVQGYGSKLKFQALQAPVKRYVLESGDSLSVVFTLATQYNENVTVRPDGFISLIGAPDVHVAGETEPEAEQTLRKAYAGILADPLMTLAVKNFESPFFVVGGEVKSPGKFVLRGDTTVAQSIAIAGGFNGTTAKDSDALLLRRVSRDYIQVRKLDLKGIDQGDISDDVHLQSGDMVFIPKNRLSKVQPFINYFLVYSVFNISFTPNGISAVGH